MATLDDRIAEITRVDRTYHDPELWQRLEPLLVEGVVRATDAIVHIGAPDYPAYMYRLGYLHGLKWLLREADNLTRIEPNKD
jgi:hypothetical protein